MRYIKNNSVRCLIYTVLSEIWFILKVQITDTSSVVLSLADSCSERHQDVVWHLEKVMKERDTLQQTLMHVTTEQVLN